MDPIDLSLKNDLTTYYTAIAALSLLSELHHETRFHGQTGFHRLWQLFASVDKKELSTTNLSKATIHLNL